MGKNRKKENRKKKITNAAIIISLIILTIPIIFVGVAGVQSIMSRGKPITGRRFANDLDPEIKSKQLDKLQDKLENLDSIENIDVNLQSATLRIYALDESLTNDNMRDKQESIYEVVEEVFTIEDYFTAHDGKKQYDLEIHIYNIEDVNEDNTSDYVYGLYVKNANMEKPYSQTLTTPQSEEMVEFFLEEEEYHNKLEEEYEENLDLEDNSEEEIEEDDEE